MEIAIDGVQLDIETLNPQEYENITIIPLKTSTTTKTDILTLKTGLDMGIVEVCECNPSTVSKVLVKNNAVTPLILVDGDEITGAMQNRIITVTTLVPAGTTMEIPVNCTEHGRWQYHEQPHHHGHHEKENVFKSSEYVANSRTRSAKSMAFNDNMDSQSIVWSSISDLEGRISFSSDTSALNDSYENLKIDQEEFINHFKALENQNGLITIINGEIRGIEVFNNPKIYKDYHEKILRSYIIDEIAERKNNADINSKLNDNLQSKIKTVTDAISNSEFIKVKGTGLGENVKFSNSYGTGSALIYENEVIHMPYFKNIDFKKEDLNHSELIRDIMEYY